MSAWLPLLSACNLQCLTPLFFASYFSLGSFIALEGQSLEYFVNMLTTCILYCYAVRGRPRLVDYLLRVVLFLITQTKRSAVSIYNLKMYLLLLFRLQFKQTVEQARKRSLSETRSYHISINKQRFCEQNNCCLPSLCHIFTRNKYYTVSLSRNEILLLDEDSFLPQICFCSIIQ